MFRYYLIKYFVWGLAFGVWLTNALILVNPRI